MGGGGWEQGSAQYSSTETARAGSGSPIHESFGLGPKSYQLCGLGPGAWAPELQLPYMGISDNQATWPGGCAS